MLLLADDIFLCIKNSIDSYKKLLELKKKICKATRYKTNIQGFPCGSVVKNLPANAGDKGSIPDPGRSHMLLGN